VNGHQPASPRRALGAIALVALSVALCGVTPLAHADGLDDQRDAKQQQISQTQTQIAKSRTDLDLAAAAVDKSKQQLAAAQDDFSAKQKAAAAAAAEDSRLAGDLTAAQKTLSDRQADVTAAQAVVTAAEAAVAAAQAAVAQGEANLAAQRDQIGLIAQTSAQQNTTLMSLAMVFNGFDVAQMNNRAQWSTTVFTANQHAMEVLQALQVKLQADQAAAQQAQAEAERARAAAQQAQNAAAAAAADVQAKKDAAAAHLTVTKQAQAQSAAAKVTVAAQVTANQQAQQAAQDALAQHQAELAQEQKDLADIEAKIQAEIAAKQANGTGGPDQAAPAAGTFFQRPVSGPVTSNYGWRIQPITGLREMHPGVDFAAPCGAPILAAADGVVTQASWYGGYGNYTAIDLGKIGGNYYTVGYGHQSKFLVSVGQHVTRGQTIGLVGTTGLSTGCHVHFNVFKNGSTMNGLPLVS